MSLVRGSVEIAPRCPLSKIGNFLLIQIRSGLPVREGGGRLGLSRLKPSHDKLEAAIR